MKTNLYGSIPDFLPEELVTELVNSPSVRIERIVSDGHKSEPEFWYEQSENEFVVLLSGSAILEFENTKTNMIPGDYINIPVGIKHRVVATSKAEKTIWLCIFY